MSADDQELVLCLDLEHGSAELIRVAAQFGGPVRILCVVPAASVDPEASVRDRVHTLINQTHPSTIPNLEVVRGDPEDVILAYARDHPCKALVLGRRLRRIADRLYVGSTTTEVVASAPCPVLVVPIDAEETHSQGHGVVSG